MSTSDFYILNQKSTTHIGSFHNGWGSGPVIWDYLGGKYIAEKPAYSMDGAYLNKVWALAGDGRLSDSEKIALMMTFDRAYIPLDRIKEATDACLEVGNSITVHPDFQHRVSHWTNFSFFLNELSGKRFSRHARGVVLSCTSVSDCWEWPSEDWLTKAWSIFE